LVVVSQEFFETDQKTVLERCNELPEDDRPMAILMARKRYVGHMKFVGQLFRVSLLSDKIIHYALGQLFGDTNETDGIDEDSVQCLCTLMTTIGYQLETAAAKKAEHGKLMKSHLKAIKALSENKAVSSRIRFMCKDLLEMRDHGWNARREEEKAKTIAQIHKDIELEERAKEGGQQMSGRSGGGAGGGGGGGGGARTVPVNRSGTGGGNSSSSKQAATTDDDGWATVRKPAPVGRMPAAAAAAAPSSSSAGGGKAAGGFAAFNALEQKAKEEKKEKKREKEAKEAKKQAKEAKAESKAAKAAAAAADAASAGCTLSAESFAKQAKSEVEQFLASGDAQEVSEAFKEWGLPVPADTHAGPFVHQLMDLLCSKYKDKEIAATATLLISLVNDDLLPKEGVAAGLSKFCENLEDYVVDAPKAQQWMADVISTLCVAKVLDLAWLASCGGLMAEGWKLEEFFGFSTKFAVEVLGAIAKKSDTATAKGLSEVLDLRTKAEDAAALDALLTEAGVELA